MIGERKTKLSVDISFSIKNRYKNEHHVALETVSTTHYLSKKKLLNTYVTRNSLN